jgi:hypothetical protein
MTGLTGSVSMLSLILKLNLAYDAADLDFTHLQQREEHWAIVNLAGASAPYRKGRGVHARAMRSASSEEARQR